MGWIILIFSLLGIIITETVFKPLVDDGTCIQSQCPFIELSDFIGFFESAEFKEPVLSLQNTKTFLTCLYGYWTCPYMRYQIVDAHSILDTKSGVQLGLGINLLGISKETLKNIMKSDTSFKQELLDAFDPFYGPVDTDEKEALIRFNKVKNDNKDLMGFILPSLDADKLSAAFVSTVMKTVADNFKADTGNFFESSVPSQIKPVLYALNYHHSKVDDNIRGLIIKSDWSGLAEAISKSTIYGLNTPLYLSSIIYNYLNKSKNNLQAQVVYLIDFTPYFTESKTIAPDCTIPGNERCNYLDALKRNIFKASQFYEGTTSTKAFGFCKGYTFDLKDPKIDWTGDKDATALITSNYEEISNKCTTSTLYTDALMEVINYSNNNYQANSNPRVIVTIANGDNSNKIDNSTYYYVDKAIAEGTTFICYLNYNTNLDFTNLLTYAANPRYTVYLGSLTNFKSESQNNVIANSLSQYLADLPLQLVDSKSYTFSSTVKQYMTYNRYKYNDLSIYYRIASPHGGNIDFKLKVCVYNLNDLCFSDSLSASKYTGNMTLPADSRSPKLKPNRPDETFYFVVEGQSNELTTTFDFAIVEGDIRRFYFEWPVTPSRDSSVYSISEPPSDTWDVIYPPPPIIDTNDTDTNKTNPNVTKPKNYHPVKGFGSFDSFIAIILTTLTLASACVGVLVRYRSKVIETSQPIESLLPKVGS